MRGGFVDENQPARSLTEKSRRTSCSTSVLGKNVCGEISKVRHLARLKSSTSEMLRLMSEPQNISKERMCLKFSATGNPFTLI